VVRNRVMAGQQEKPNHYLESILTLAKVEGYGGLFAGATPRVGKAILSGAIQFATYEETKQKLAELFKGSHRGPSANN
jgi:solute carrier family 25 (mitochondrial S-adenosylmethionine transporter), member 26